MFCPCPYLLERIATLTGAETFAAFIKEEAGQGFPPDDPFEASIDFKTGAAVYTPEEARLRNKLTDQAFVVCKRAGADVYAVTGGCWCRGRRGEELPVSRHKGLLQSHRRRHRAEGKQLNTLPDICR